MPPSVELKTSETMPPERVDIQGPQSASKPTGLIFIDTNIWLDFYRSRTEAGITLLKHVETIADRVIVSPQVEMEFKKNRQATILEAINNLETFKSVPQPGIFSDAKAAKALKKNQQRGNDLVRGMKVRLGKILEQPSAYDPVYKIFQRIFHKDDSLHLTRENPIRRTIRNKALKRFLLGYPPRKKNDTSMGDAMNWEWLIYCAEHAKSDVVIVSRDSDYGVSHGDKVYLNDHLKQEFSERVSFRRKIFLCTKLSEGLKKFRVPVTKQERAEENSLIETSRGPERSGSLASFLSGLVEGKATDTSHVMTLSRDLDREVARLNTQRAMIQAALARAAGGSKVSGESE